MAQNLKKIKAIEKENIERLLKVNPKLNDKPGIYFLLRVNESGFKFAYIGQASTSIIHRLASHLVGYKQHIDLSLRKHKLYSENNPYGWRVEFLNFPPRMLDEKEKEFIKKYAEAGNQLGNVSVGGKGENREAGQIGERKWAKGNYDGLAQGYKNASKEISHLFDLHLDYKIKSDKPNKNQEKAKVKFENFLNFYKGDDVCG